jgi:uncharacterized membrane protein YfhO
VRGDGWDQATVTCARATILTRRVQYVPGWSATVDGTAVPVGHATGGPPGLFQQVAVPAGTSTVQFTFVPPHEVPAFAAALVAVLAIVGTLAVESWRRRRPVPVPTTSPPGAGGPVPG